MRPLLALAYASLCFASVLFFAPRAHAAPASANLISSNGELLGCTANTLTAIVDCTSADQCAEFGRTCTTLSGGQAVCSYTSGALYDVLCCTAASDCGTRLGVTGRCAPILAATGGVLNDSRVCVYPGVFDFCSPTSDSVSDTRYKACMKIPGTTTYSNDWRAGDCDGDGVKNAEDCNPCDRANTSLRGVGCSTLPTTPDPGQGSADASSSGSEGDAGVLGGQSTAAYAFDGGGGLACTLSRRPTDTAPQGFAWCAFALIASLVQARRKRKIGA